MDIRFAVLKDVEGIDDTPFTFGMYKGKTPDEVAKELKEAGLPVQEEGEPKTAAELAEEIEEEYYYTEEELNEVIENLRNLLYDMFLNPEEEPSETPPTQEPPVRPNSQESSGTRMMRRSRAATT